MDDGKRFKFCTLPAIIILKLLAWDDRPEDRTDDILDMCDVLSHYFNMNDTDIWENHSDLFTEEAINQLHVATKVIGRKMKEIAKRNENLYARLKKILDDNTNKPEDSRMAHIMLWYFKNTLEENVALIHQLKAGFQEQRTTD